MKPQRIIVLALAGTLAVNVSRQLKGGKVPAADLAVGAALSGVLILSLAEFAPKVGSGLAIIMLITALTDPQGTGGQVELLRAVGKITGGGAKAGTTPDPVKNLMNGRTPYVGSM